MRWYFYLSFQNKLCNSVYKFGPSKIFFLVPSLSRIDTEPCHVILNKRTVYHKCLTKRKSLLMVQPKSSKKAKNVRIQHFNVSKQCEDCKYLDQWMLAACRLPNHVINYKIPGKYSKLNIFDQQIKLNWGIWNFCVRKRYCICNNYLFLTSVLRIGRWKLGIIAAFGDLQIAFLLVSRKELAMV